MPAPPLIHCGSSSQTSKPAGGYQALSPEDGANEDIYSIARNFAWDIASCETNEEAAEEGELIRAEFDIPEDSYGAAILAIVKDMHNIGRGEDKLMTVARFMTPIILLFLNLVSQTLILFFISKHVVQPAVRGVQVLFRDFHSNVYDEQGYFLESDWQIWVHKDELCQIAMTNPIFYYLIMFIWAMSMMQEFRTAERFLRDVSAMPPCNNADEMIEETLESGRSVVALTHGTRLALYMLICFPKLAISVYLWYCGAEWLSATMSFGDLVLNTCGMTFVTQIDELLYLALLPVPYQKQVADINFCLHERSDPEKSKHSEYYSYRRSCGYLAFGMGMVFVYSHFIQDVLPWVMLGEVKARCHSYSHGQRVVCDWEDMMSGESLECFPYGK